VGDQSTGSIKSVEWRKYLDVKEEEVGSYKQSVKLMEEVVVRRSQEVQSSVGQVEQAVAVGHGGTEVKPELNTPATGGVTQCNHHRCSYDGHNCSAHTDEIDHKTFLAINACAAVADETTSCRVSIQ